MDVFDSIAKAKPASKGGGPYFQQGKGVAVLKGFRQGESFRKDQIFVADFQIESSTSFPGALDKDGKPEFANAPGTSAAYVQNLSKFPENAPSNAQTCILSVLACEVGSTGDLENITRAQYEYALAKTNPCRGIRVGFEVRQVKTKKGGVINVVDFAPIPGQTDEEIAGRRAALDTGETYSTKLEPTEV